MSTNSVSTFAPFGTTSPWEYVFGPGSGKIPSNVPLVMAQFGDFIYAVALGGQQNIAFAQVGKTDIVTSLAYGGLVASLKLQWPVAVPWNEVSKATSDRPLSLAVFGETLYLCYLGDGNNEVNIYGIAGENTGVFYQIPGVSAQYATVVAESVSGEDQLAVYYVDASNSTLQRTATSSPETAPTKKSNSWFYNNINYQSGDDDGVPKYSGQTASGPLAVVSANGITTIAYQGGTTKDKSNTIYMSTSAGGQLLPNSWQVNAYIDPGQSTYIGLGIDNDGQNLTIGYQKSGDNTALQLGSLVYEPGYAAYSPSLSTVVDLESPISAVSLLQANTSSGSALLFGGSLDEAAQYPIAVSPPEITIASSGDVGLSDVATQPTASDGTLPVMLADGSTLSTLLPSGITSIFNGSLSFTVSGLTPGGTTDVLINLPVRYSGDGNAYVRYNYATGRFEDYRDAQGNRLYAFTDTDRDGVRDAITLTLVDGDAQWDRDGLANGSVVDPGFLASGAIEITGDGQNNRLSGNILANQIRGKGKRDLLIGDLGDDILRGGKGDDRLNGGEGADILIGGHGADRFRYSALIDSTVERSDTLQFGRRDQIDLRQLDANTTRKGNQAFSFIADAKFSGQAGELRLFESRLLADVDGDRQADFALNLRSNQAFSSDVLML
jgi:Ca2+-binding RTX toxin-like protein